MAETERNTPCGFTFQGINCGDVSGHAGGHTAVGAMPTTALELMAERLERFIDTSSLDSVLEIIEGICAGKAEHLRANGQEEASAKTWERAAKVIAKAANSKGVLAVRG